MKVDSTATSLLAILMFGAGTDYCLLLVARYKEDLHRFEDEHEALRYAIPRAVAGDRGERLDRRGRAADAARVEARHQPDARPGHGDRRRGRAAREHHAAARDAQPARPPRLLAVDEAGRVRPGRRRPEPDVRADAAGPLGRLRAPGDGAGRRRRVGGIAVLVVGALGLADLQHPDPTPVKEFRTSPDSLQGYELFRQSFPVGAVSPSTVLVERDGGPATRGRCRARDEGAQAAART